MNPLSSFAEKSSAIMEISLAADILEIAEQTLVSAYSDSVARPQFTPQETPMHPRTICPDCDRQTELDRRGYMRTAMVGRANDATDTVAAEKTIAGGPAVPLDTLS
jgi:hypothetical protein